MSPNCDPPDWLIKICHQSGSSRVTETAFLTWLCGKCFQKCFSVESLIIVSLNTVYQSLLLFSYQRLLDVATNGLFIAIQCLLLFKGSVMGDAYRRILTQIRLQLCCALADRSIL